MQSENRVKHCNMMALMQGVNEEAKSPMHREQSHNTLNSKHTRLLRHQLSTNI